MKICFASNFVILFTREVEKSGLNGLEQYVYNILVQSIRGDSLKKERNV